MKKIIFLLLVFLAPMWGGAQDSPLQAGQPKVEEAATPEISVSVSVSIGPQQGPILFPEPVERMTPTSCAIRNNSYCTYSWDRIDRCCYATYIAPGATCPNICE